MSTYADLGEKSIATQLYQKYRDCGVNLKGLQLLARRALSRGYSEMVVSYCLETVIKKTSSATNIMETMLWMKEDIFLMQNLEQLCVMGLRMIFCGVKKMAR